VGCLAQYFSGFAEAAGLSIVKLIQLFAAPLTSARTFAASSQSSILHIALTALAEFRHKV
jgi:hypothetical protein